MPWFFAAAERDHSVQNPTSPEKIRRLGELLRLRPESRLVDIACGKCGPAMILAETLGCPILGVKRAPEFAQVARERIAEAGLKELIEVIEQDAREFPLEPNAFDAALCLGASFIWDGLDGTLAALVTSSSRSRSGVGGRCQTGSTPKASRASWDGRAVQAAELVPIGLIAAEDDWDAYESLHWRALEDWLAEKPDDPDANDIRRLHGEARDQYLTLRRGLFGWAIFVSTRPRTVRI